MAKKRIALIVICIVASILVVDFLINGFEFSIYGVCSFNTKYYDSPKTAFEQHEDLNILEDIGIAEMDSHNVMYFAKTQSGDILAAQMKRKMAAISLLAIIACHRIFPLNPIRLRIPIFLKTVCTRKTGCSNAALNIS